MNLPKQYSNEKDFEKVMFIYDSALKEVETKIEILNNEFKMKSKHNPIEHVTSRLKTPQSIAKKLRHNGKEFTIENIVKYINDIAGIRIICSFKSDIYSIAEAISKQNDVEVLKIKDYVTNPKENGYSSYHMIVSVPIYLVNAVVDTKVEIQIRTIAMDYWASLEQKIYYKFEGNAPKEIRKELKECADLVSYLDDKMLSINNEVNNYKINSSVDTDDEFTNEKNMLLSFGHVYEEETQYDKSYYNNNEYVLEDYKLINSEDDYSNDQELHNTDSSGRKNKKNLDNKKSNSKEKNKLKKPNEKVDKSLLGFFKTNHI